MGFPASEISLRFRMFDRKISDAPPEFRSISDAHLDPLIPLGQWKFRGGVYSRGEFVGELSVRRGSRSTEIQFATAAGAIRKPESRLEVAWFGGIHFGHFGHFLLETLARVQSREVVQSPEPIVFFNPWGAARLQPFMEGAFRHLGISLDRILLCNAPLEIGTLHVQEPTFQLNGFIKVSARNVLQRQICSDHKQSGIVYLARSNAKVLRRVLEEEEFQRQLEFSALGEVVHPERLSFADQVECMRRSDVVSGCEGSAFHTLMFVEGMRTSLMFCANLPSLNYFLCDEVIDGNAIYVSCCASLDRPERPMLRTTDWTLDVEKAINLVDHISGSILPRS